MMRQEKYISIEGGLVLTILDAFKIDELHLIGHSMGGFIVQLLGIHYSERVISMTSISSSTNAPTIPKPPEETWAIFFVKRTTK